jgi:hypothetical protein
MDTACLLYDIKGLCIDSIQANPSIEAERYLHKRFQCVQILSDSFSPPLPGQVQCSLKRCARIDRSAFR